MPGQPANVQTLKLIASGFGSVAALVRLLNVPFCSGTEAAVKLLGGMAQNVAGMAVEVAREGPRSSLLPWHHHARLRTTDRRSCQAIEPLKWSFSVH